MTPGRTGGGPVGPRIDPVGLVFALAMPLIGAAILLAATAAWVDRLPDPMATHWSSGAGPDGFSSPWSNAGILVAIIVVVGGGCALPAVFARGQLMLRRIMLVVGGTVTGLITAVGMALLVGQLDLVDAAEADPHWWPVGVGVSAGLAVGLAGAMLLRDRRPRTPADGPPPPGLPRAADPAPLTFRIGVPSRVLAVLVGVLVVLAVGTSLAAGAVWAIAIYLPVLWLLLVTARYRVDVDQAAITVRSAGMTMISYGIDEIVAAETVTVSPFGDFGGWGLRAVGRGRYAVATATGPATRIEFAGGHVLTVTAPHADELTGVLNALADARFAGPGPRTGPTH